MRNAHDIAIELEHMLCREFGFDGRPRGTIFDADAIETYMFYDIICLLLYRKSNSGWDDFANRICQYKGVNMNQIPEYEKVFDEFKLLIV
ncbi:MAG TPA: hypothetical protein DEW35_05870 [Ruminococcaceae bacterium]|nr:hypothetical protein [Oscillospiraceae bacterium]